MDTRDMIRMNHTNGPNENVSNGPTTPVGSIAQSASVRYYPRNIRWPNLSDMETNHE